MKQLAIFVILLLIINPTEIFAGEKKHENTWLSFDQGMEAARKSDKKILVDVYTDWCGWCKRMDHDVYSQQAVIDYLTKNYVLVRLNAESDAALHYDGKQYTETDLARGFGVNGYPTILFLSSAGRHITTLPGYVDAEKFLAIVKFVGEDYYKTMKWEEYLEAQGKTSPASQDSTGGRGTRKK